MVTSVSPPELPVTVDSAVDPYLASYLIPAHTTAIS